METAASVEFYLRVVALATALSICLNLTLWATIDKYNGWEWYDTYKKPWMPARTCMLCVAHLMGYVYMVPASLALVIALRAPGFLALLAVPFLISALTLKLASK
jgi:hypothetical protein